MFGRLQNIDGFRQLSITIRNTEHDGHSENKFTMPIFVSFYFPLLRKFVLNSYLSPTKLSHNFHYNRGFNTRGASFFKFHVTIILLSCYQPSLYRRVHYTKFIKFEPPRITSSFRAGNDKHRAKNSSDKINIITDLFVAKLYAV